MLNIDKCEILVSPRHVGNQPNINLQSKAIAVKDPIKILGCWLSTSPSSDASIQTSPNSGEHSLPMEVSAYTLESLVLHHHYWQMCDANPSIWCRKLGWILLGRTWKESSKAKFAANEAPLLALRWPTMKARILCLVQKVEFPEKIGTEGVPYLPASYISSPEDIVNMSLIWQCRKLETYLGTNFTMLTCEAILKSPEAKSIPDPTRELLKEDFNYILTRAHTHSSLNYAINFAIQGI